MARTDAIVLGAGIVGTSVALHLAKKGLAVALVDKRGPGEETSYGNTGVIVGASVFPTAFPRSLSKLIQVALKRAPEANYHWGDLLKVAPWLYRLLRLVHPGEAEGQRRQAAAADGACGRRAQGSDRGIRRVEIFPRDRLDDALSPRRRVRGDEAAARIRRADRRRGAAARHRGRACARAEPRAGVPPRPDVAGRRLIVQSADGDARLCGAVFRAHRCGPQGRCALTASCQRQVAGRHRRGAGRCRECRCGARAVVDRRSRRRSASRSRSGSSAAITATTTRRATRHCRGRSSTPNTAMRSPRWSRGSG